MLKWYNTRFVKFLAGFLANLLLVVAVLAIIGAGWIWLSGSSGREVAARLTVGLWFGWVLIRLSQHWWTRRKLVAQAPLPIKPGTTLRGLLPFEDGDYLPAREHDVDWVVTMIKDREFRFGVLMGTSGCGKTSLLRAGIVPRLRNETLMPIYLERPTKDLVGSIVAGIMALGQLEPIRVRDNRVEDWDSEVGRIHLRQGLVDYFKESELMELMFDLGIDWETLGARDKSSLAIELVQFMSRRGRLAELVKSVQNARPNGLWSTEEIQKPGIKAANQEDDWKGYLRNLGQKGIRLVVLLDQFEEFFLTGTDQLRTAFGQWLREVVADRTLPIMFLVGIREDYAARLSQLGETGVLEPLMVRTMYELRNFDVEQAGEVLTLAARAEKVEMTPDLVQTVVEDLGKHDKARPGLVMPAELQIVGMELKRRRIQTVNQYVVAGGDRGILSTYIAELAKWSGNERAARLMLRLMCAEDGQRRQPEDLTIEEIWRGVIGTGTQDIGADAYVSLEEVIRLLRYLVEARIVMRMQDGKYNLVHDYLAGPVRRATADLETNVEWANRRLTTYLARYEEELYTSIPWRYIWPIWRSASRELRSSPQAKALFRHSIAHIVALPVSIVGILGIIYVGLYASYYLDIEPSMVIRSPMIVVRRGVPELPVPGLGEIVVRTGFTVESLASTSNIRQEVSGGKIRGFWFTKVNGYENWAKQIATLLDTQSKVETQWYLDKRIDYTPVREILALAPDYDEVSARLSGWYRTVQLQPDLVTEDDVKALKESLNQPERARWIGQTAAWALSEIAQVRSDLSFSDANRKIVETLFEYDDFMGPVYMNAADMNVPVIDFWLMKDPQLVTSQMIETKKQRILKGGYSGGELLNLAQVLLSVQPYRDIITPEIMEQVIMAVRDPLRNSASSEGDAQGLELLVKAKPEAIREDMIAGMVNELLDIPKLDRFMEANQAGDLTRTLVVLSVICEARPEFLNQSQVNKAIAMVRAEQPHEVKGLSSQLYGALAFLQVVAKERPDLVGVTFRREMIERFVDVDRDDYERQMVGQVLADLGRVAPGREAREDLGRIESIVVNTTVEPELRMLAAQSLIPFASAYPSALTPAVLKSVAEAVIDKRFNSDYFALYVPYSRPRLRMDPFSILRQLAEIAPSALTPEVVEVFGEAVRNPTVHPQTRKNAAASLAALARLVPEAVLKEEEVLEEFADTVGYFPRTNDIRGDIASAYLAREARSGRVMSPEELGALLHEPRHPLRREVGSYVIFLAAVQDVNRLQGVRKMLETMQGDSSAVVRIAAGRTLEMLRDAEMIQVARYNSQVRWQLRRRLEMATSPIYYTYSTSTLFVLGVMEEELNKMGGINKKN